MTTNNKQKINQEIISKLQSKDSEIVFKTIEKLRETGNSAYIPALIDLLHSSKNEEINSKIFALLADIKHRDTIPQLLDAIQNKKYAEERRRLVSICWESGLDFSPNLPVFIDLLINESIEVAIEAYTVITNMDGKITMDVVNAEIDKMKTSIGEIEDQKKQLLVDIIEFLPQLSE